MKKTIALSAVFALGALGMACETANVNKANSNANLMMNTNTMNSNMMNSNMMTPTTTTTPMESNTSMGSNTNTMSSGNMNSMNSNMNRMGSNMNSNMNKMGSATRENGKTETDMKDGKMMTNSNMSKKP